MRRIGKVVRRVGCVFAFATVCGMFVGMNQGLTEEVVSAYAATEEGTLEETKASSETEEKSDATEPETNESDMVEGAGPNGTDETIVPPVEVRPFTFRDWFGLVFCIVFGVGICLVVAFYGDPRDRERIRNKKLKEQLAQKAAKEESRKKSTQEKTKATGDKSKTK